MCCGAEWGGGDLWLSDYAISLLEQQGVIYLVSTHEGGGGREKRTRGSTPKVNTFKYGRKSPFLYPF